MNRRPDDGFGAALESALGSFDTRRVNGHLNLPLGAAAARFAFTASGGDGYIRNSIDDRRFAEDDWFGFRATLRFDPAAATTVILSAQHTEDDGATGELWLPRRDFLPDPGDIRLTTVTLADPRLDATNDLVGVDVSRTLGAVSLRSITGYARNETRNVDDCAGLPRLQGCVRGVSPLSYEQWSQEVQVSGKDGAFADWVLGLYLLDADEHTRFFFRAPLLAPGPINDYAANARQRAYAIFGQATRRLAERWRLTGGLRFSREASRVSDIGTGAADNQSPANAAGSWSDTSWRLDLQYLPDDFSLLYASAATGFKSGGNTTERLPGGGFDDYGPEHLLAWEVGVKRQSPQRRASIEASVFVYDFRDLQVRTTALLADRVTTVIDNAAVARVAGLDLAAAVDVAERWTVSGALVWLPRREFVEFTSVEAGDIAPGNKLSRAAEWSGSASLGYRWPLRRLGRLSARLDYNYRSAFFFTGQNDPETMQGAFGLLNLFLRLESLDDRWYLFASGRNLADADYFEQIFIQSSPGRPATVELGFGLAF